MPTPRRDLEALHEPPTEEKEAFQALVSRAHKKFGAVPAELIAKHVLEITRDADWPVRREALEALLRRQAFGRGDELRIDGRPPGGHGLGLYTTRRKGSGARPYRTALESVDPPRGSCDCADFLRSSLGLCKHLLAILEDLASRPRVFEKVRTLPPLEPPPLCWDPVRPLRGLGDPLAQIRWTKGPPPDSFKRWCRSLEDGRWTIAVPTVVRPRERHDLITALLAEADGRRDPALRTLLLLERDRNGRRVLGLEASMELVGALKSLKQKLYGYQRAAVERFLAGGRLLLADDMGLGKTAQAIAASHALFEAGRVRRGLLVVPAALKPQWLREWQMFTDAPAAIVDGSPADRRAAFEKTRKGFLIVNYEQLLRDLEVMHAWKPDFVVLDEAQRIKNWATKTSLYVKRLQPAYRLVLTGTPMENRLEELASIVEWVDDFALEPKWRLVPWHTAPVDGRKEIGGARNLDTLRSRLEGCLVRRLRKDVLPQLPPRTDTRVPVEMTPEQQEEHDALNQPIARLVAIARKRPLTQAEFLRLMMLLTTQRIISNGLAQLRFVEIWPSVSKIERPSDEALKGLSSPKLAELREVVGRLVVDQGRKAVVFSQWRRMLKLAHWAVRDLLEGEGLRAAFFTGHEGQKKRTQNIVDFHDDPQVALLFASDAGGVGLNLQRAANAVINLELPWNPAVLEQRIGRIYRLGQKSPIDVYNLVCEYGIESRILDLVGSKKALFTGLFDGTSDEVRFERSGSFLSRIEKLVAPVRVPDLPKAADGVDDDPGAERELERLTADTDGAEPEGAPAAAAALPRPEEVQKLFSRLTIRKGEKGGVVIEAPEDTAGTLAALFQGMAEMLRGGGR